MKIGRNDPCPCGSGKKYKHCCLYNNTPQNEYDQIRNTVKKCGYADNIADILCNLLRYMKEEKWIGACHATSAVLFVTLSELGYSPNLCIGEVRDPATGYLFDHSWIELDGKIIDLAISMTLLGGKPLSEPIVFDLNIRNTSKYSCIYGVTDGKGLDAIAKQIQGLPFVDYMDKSPVGRFGLWSVVNSIGYTECDIQKLRNKYSASTWNYVRSK